MDWEMPFGSILEGNLVGSQEFLSLRLQEEEEMPKQSDEGDYNCGIGVLDTTIAFVCVTVLDLLIYKTTSLFVRNFSV